MEKTEKEFIFKRYKELYDELVEIDEKLSCQCRQEIQGFLERKAFDDAKTYVHMFYHTKSAEDGNFDSIEKDLIYASINRLIREEKNKG